MKKLLNLGKIFLFLPLILFAQVDVSVSKNAIFPGESVDFIISATGSDIKFPNINKIADYPITNSGMSTSLVIINGKASKTIKKFYTFTPDKNITIPSFKVIVDGKEYQTKPIKVTILSSKAALSKIDAKLEIALDKNSSYVGEPLNFYVTLKINQNANIAKAQLEPPNIPNAWIESIPDTQKSIEGNFVVQKYHFILFPQSAGQLKIGPVYADIAKVVQRNNPFIGSGINISFFGQELRWKRIASNSIVLNVKALPNNLELFGNFHISAMVDKTKVQANSPVHLTIKVEGSGNIEDIKKFTLNIPNAVVYSDEPKIKAYVKNKEYQGVFLQKVTIISDSNFTIPSISLRYFDKTSKKEKEIQTKPIKIEVIGGKKEKVVVQSASQTPQAKIRTKVVYKFSWLWIGVSFIAGVFVGIGLMFFRKKETKKEQKEIPLIKKIKKAKGDKEFFDLLLPLSKNEKLQEILQKLEENLYKGAKHKIDKNEIIKELERKEDEKLWY